jgi:DNA-binding NarL/FixJ family response regulator
LVAAGLTNRDIAEILFLSEHTVRSHVRSILTKTQTENRTAAALFAHEHNLS